jgi:hypothetical protein
MGKSADPTDIGCQITVSIGLRPADDFVASRDPAPHGRSRLAIAAFAAIYEMETAFAARSGFCGID